METPNSEVHDEQQQQQQVSYQCGERVSLHVESLQELQAFILQQLNGEIVQVSVVEEQVLVALLLGNENSVVQFGGHV